jgi:hypothetical protein
MKKYLLSLIAFVVLMSAVNAKDGEKSKSSAGVAIMKNGTVFKLFYKAETKGTVRIAIYNEKNDKLYSETLRHISNFMRPYNFSTLKEGEYTIEVTDESGKVLKKVSYINKPSPSRDGKQIYLKSLPGNSDKYVLSVNSKSKDVLSIRIYDNLNQILYNSKEAISGDFSRIYRVKNKQGKVTFQVIDQEGNVKTFEQ